MRIEKIKLRDKPNLEFSFKENEFEIINNADRNNSGIYFYKKVKSIKLKKERTNWLITIISFIVDFFLQEVLLVVELLKKKIN